MRKPRRTQGQPFAAADFSADVRRALRPESAEDARLQVTLSASATCGGRSRVRHGLVAGPRRQSLQRAEVHAVAEEADRAVGIQEVGAAGVVAPEMEAG